MFGLGTTELVVIAFVIVLLFGGRKLPQLGRSMGSAITNFKKGLSDPNNEKSEQEESKKD
ncbi:MAG: twin-arginine translocase TatA/TatE family subunit [Bacteriovoracaceae bacterium]|jgi:sec-independent protein translocase protein TatA|nr:twin-arginine translocase TatA/TatE family subunit [Halobacteriovoraceae bacterium]MDP7319236.1 twin-arginine translocase TatA/TatE family subunit [Bacteriovoracaceae bacterium]|tara:strand:- start:371 stop:550 length:180 start_codon:yes stop_codon:yes gene_type:complete